MFDVILDALLYSASAFFIVFLTRWKVMQTLSVRQTMRLLLMTVTVCPAVALLVLEVVGRTLFFLSYKRTFPDPDNYNEMRYLMVLGVGILFLVPLCMLKMSVRYFQDGGTTTSIFEKENASQ